MSRARRGLLLAGLSLLLGGLAAADVGRREAALAARMGPPVEVVVARQDLPAGTEIGPRHLAVRRVPARYAPAGAAVVPAEVLGGRLAAAVVRGGPVGPGLLAAEAVRGGERALPLVATGSPDLVVPGARVDVLVTREHGTDLALRGVEVLTSEPAGEGAGGSGAPRVAVTLRVRLRQAVQLTEAEAFAREIRLLAAGTR